MMRHALAAVFASAAAPTAATGATIHVPARLRRRGTTGTNVDGRWRGNPTPARHWRDATTRP